MGSVGARVKKVPGKSTGENGTKVMSGYAAGPVPKIMIGSKSGISPSYPYSGPPVAQRSRSEA